MPQTPGIDNYADLSRTPSARNLIQSADRIGALGVGMFGAGAALRGLQGLADLFRGTRGAPPKLPLRQSFVGVPIRRDDEEKRAAGPYTALAAGFAALQKRAGPAALPPVPPLNWHENLAGRGLNFLGLLPGGKNWNPSYETLLNPRAAHMGQMSWTTPVGVAATLGGLGAGYKLTDMALDASRTHEQDTELDAARRDYEAALTGRAKAASDPIDRAFDAWKKQAAGTGSSPLGDAYAPSLGLLATAMGLTGVGAGVFAYHQARDRSEEDTVDDALRKRREQLFAAAPPAILALPTPIPAPRASRFRALLGGRAAKAAAASPGPAAAASQALQRLGANRQRLAEQTAALFGMKQDAGKAQAPKPAGPPPPPTVVNPHPQPTPG